MNKPDKRQPNEAMNKFLQILKKNQYVLIVLFVGLIIILIPGSSDTKEDPEAQVTASEESELYFSVEEQEKKIAQALSEIEGAGDVTVVLSVKTSTEQEVAVDEDGEKTQTVIISSSEGTESALTLRYIYPEYQGALIVTEGAENATTKLNIIEAVANLTGLGTDKITVTKKQN